MCVDPSDHSLAVGLPQCRLLVPLSCCTGKLAAQPDTWRWPLPATCGIETGVSSTATVHGSIIPSGVFDWLIRIGLRVDRHKALTVALAVVDQNLRGIDMADVHRLELCTFQY